MSSARSRALLAAGLLVHSASGVAAQTIGGRPEMFLGTEVRILNFDRLVGVQRLRQTAVPVGAIVPIGRFTLDLGSAWVSSELERADGTTHQVNALTDTQLRGSYVFGRDAVVATILLNLPTGLKEANARDYSVIGAISPNLLGFPVASYASGFSVTSGLAASIPAGDWSIGLAGSLRVSSKFTPYADALGQITYKPGAETRIRGALDGLLGSSRLALGFTYSTFGDDQFGLTTTARGQYRPGPRWLAEALLVSPIGNSTLNLSVWNFRRTAGDTTGTSTRNQENLAAGEISMTIPLARAVALEPTIGGRMSKPETGRGRLGGAGMGLRIQLSDALSFTPLARYDSGWIEDTGGARSDLHGWYMSAFLRVLL